MVKALGEVRSTSPRGGKGRTHESCVATSCGWGVLGGLAPLILKKITTERSEGVRKRGVWGVQPPSKRKRNYVKKKKGPAEDRKVGQKLVKPELLRTIFGGQRGICSNLGKKLVKPECLPIYFDRKKWPRRELVVNLGRKKCVKAGNVADLPSFGSQLGLIVPNRGPNTCKTCVWGPFGDRS